MGNGITAEHCKAKTGQSSGAVVLLCKRPGITSFDSLYQIKRAFKTRKVGHTGTLDSFATGLLVVCVGPLTRLVPYITQFDKSYEAVIEFGKETDTLEWTGKTVRTAPLPSIDSVMLAVEKFTGNIMQTPPQFSAIHVAGRRASDIARSNGEVNIPARAVTVHSAEVQDVMLQAACNKAIAVKVAFTVSKSTYIRSLARDIGKECGSAGSLAALRRTAVGPFRLENAAFYDTLMPLTIKGALNTDAKGNRIGEGASDIDENKAESEILDKAACMTRSLAMHCGFSVVTITDELKEDVIHGRQTRELRSIVGKGMTALFDKEGRFLSLCEGGRSKFVLPYSQ